jgi:hypothetical protein
MALSYRIYPADTQIAPQLVTSNVIDPNTILGLHQGRNGFANLIICIAEAWYLEKIRELTENRDNAIIDKWWTNYNASLIGQPWCEVFSAAIIGEAIKECGVTNLYPKSSDKVRIYKTSDNKIPSYNWELLDKEIRDNKLKQVQDVISANAFRASVYLIDNLRKYNVKVSSEPTPGSRFYRYSTGSGSSGHAGIVIAIKDGFFYTIEGNVYLDAQKLSQGVGMYRYPIAAAQNQATGFTFFDFSSYPSGMGNISCESKDFSYIYTGLDGKTKTRKCYKPPTPPKDVTEDPPGEKPPVEIPPTPPTEKPPCDPKLKIDWTKDSIEVRKKKCENFTSIKIPDASSGLLQHFSNLKEFIVTSDITENIRQLDATKIAQRNGAALWYGPNSPYSKDTSKATGFGMFRDKVGNIIYVIDLNNEKSNQLGLAGLLGFEIPTDYTEQVGNQVVFKKQININGNNHAGNLGTVLYFRRDLCNFIQIQPSKGSYDDDKKLEIAYRLVEGKMDGGNGFYNTNGSWAFDDKPNEWIGSERPYGLDFNDEDYSNNILKADNENWKVKVPYSEIKDTPGTKQVNFYKLLDYIERNGIKLSKPIIITVAIPSTPPPLISQDFISILQVAGALTTLVGVPIPFAAVLSAAKFGKQLETAMKDGIKNPIALADGAFNFMQGVAPDFIKGVESNAKKFLKDKGGMISEQIKKYGKEAIGWAGSPDALGIGKALGIGGNIGNGIDLKFVGEYFNTAYQSIKLASVNMADGAKKLGLDEIVFSDMIDYYQNLDSAGLGVVDIRQITGGMDFKTVRKNVTNAKGQLAAGKIINLLSDKNTSFREIAKIKSATNLASNPIMRELVLNTVASDIMGMFPKAPELASAFAYIKKTNYLSAQSDGQRIAYGDQFANIVSAGMGYDIKDCNLFKEEVLSSVKKEAINYMKEGVTYFIPQTINSDEAECYKYEIEKITKGKITIINCPEGWTYDVKTNTCKNETINVGYDGGGNFNFDGGGDFDLKIDVGVPKCIQSSFGTYVFYFRGIPLAAMKSTDGKWIAAWGGKNYFIDVDKCQLMGVPPETDKPSNEPPTPPAIPLPKCITIRNGKYYYNLRYAVGLSDGLISKELTDLFANTKTPIGGASPQDLLNYANAIGIDTSKITNNPTVSSAIKTVDKVDNLINTLKTTSSSQINNTSSPTGSPIVANNPVTSNVSSVTSASNTNKPILNVTQAASEEEAYYMNGKWYLLRGGKYVEIIDCIPVAAKVYKCGIIERDGEFIFTKNGAEYKAVKNFDNDFYVFINGQYYQLDANCNPITPKPGTKECDECEKLVEVEKQNRIKLEKAFSESKVSNDSKIKELINLLNIQTQKSLELEKQIILRSGSSTTNNDSKYNELLTQLQNERERVNQLSKLIEQSKTGGNNNDSVIREIIISLNQEKERSQKLEQKISELEQMKSDNSSSSDSREYFNNLDNISKEKSFEKEISTEKEKLPNCITLENGKYYFTGMVQNDTLKLIALNTAKGWVASYQSSYYMIDLANCKLLTGNLRGETNFTGECTDCVQNTQPRIVERSEKIVYGGFKQGLDPEVYEDCDDCE